MKPFAASELSQVPAGQDQRAERGGGVGIPNDPLNASAVFVARIRTGDERAFAEAYRSYAPGTFRLAYAILGDRAGAEEVVQEVFLSLWRRRAVLEVRGRLDLYLLVAARNQARNAVRQQRTIARIEVTHAHDERVSGMGSPPLNANARVDAEELYRIVSDAVSRLPERRRDAFILRWQHRLGYADIARVMGISVEAAQMHVSRARDVLRRVVANLE